MSLSLVKHFFKPLFVFLYKKKYLWYCFVFLQQKVARYLYWLIRKYKFCFVKKRFDLKIKANDIIWTDLHCCHKCNTFVNDDLWKAIRGLVANRLYKNSSLLNNFVFVKYIFGNFFCIHLFANINIKLLFVAQTPFIPSIAFSVKLHLTFLFWVSLFFRQTPISKTSFFLFLWPF